jgi:hypothetical protein
MSNTHEVEEECDHRRAYKHGAKPSKDGATDKASDSDVASQLVHFVLSGSITCRTEKSECSLSHTRDSQEIRV